MPRRRKRRFSFGGPGHMQRRRSTVSVDAADKPGLDRVPGRRQIRLGSVFATAAAMSVAGATWIALQPAATHSPLDGALFGSLLRWIFYLPPTVLGVWLAAGRLDRMGQPGPGPVVTALVLAVPAVVAGTLAETFVRLGLGRGDVLALDGVLQRVLELVRIDVPIGAIAALMLARPAIPRWFRHSQVVGRGTDPTRR